MGLWIFSTSWVKIMIKKILGYALLLTALGIVYLVVYELSGVWELPLISYCATVIVLAVFEVIEFRKNKEKENV